MGGFFLPNNDARSKAKGIPLKEVMLFLFTKTQAT
jgi:hypothetical protein